MVHLNIDNKNEVFKIQKQGCVLLVHIKNYCDFLFGENRQNEDNIAYLDHLIHDRDIFSVLFCISARQSDIDCHLGKFNSWAEMREHLDHVFEITDKFEHMILEILKRDKIFISAMTGSMDIGIFTLSLACDYRISTNDFFISAPKTKIGLLLADFSEYFLARIAGSLKTGDIVASNERMSSQQLLTFNLVDQIVPYEKLICDSMQKSEVIVRQGISELSAIKKQRFQHFEDYLEFKNERLRKFLTQKHDKANGQIQF
jgi:enoyl-CoA hydratase/carnithine racemase